MISIIARRKDPTVSVFVDEHDLFAAALHHLATKCDLPSLLIENGVVMGAGDDLGPVGIRDATDEDVFNFETLIRFKSLAAKYYP